MITLTLDPLLFGLVAGLVLACALWGVFSLVTMPRLQRRLYVALERNVELASLVMAEHAVMSTCPRCARHLAPPRADA